MKNARKLLLLLAICTAVVSKPAQAVGSPITLFGFQLSGIFASQAAVNSVFVQGAWTPSLNLGLFGIRGEIGITALDFGSGRFMVTNYEVLLQLNLFPSVGIEGGAGLHVWHGIRPAATAFTGNLVFTAVPGVDRVFAGYTRYTGGVGADEIRLGIGFGI